MYINDDVCINVKNVFSSSRHNPNHHLYSQLPLNIITMINSKHLCFKCSIEDGLFGPGTSMVISLLKVDICGFFSKKKASLFLILLIHDLLILDMEASSSAKNQTSILYLCYTIVIWAPLLCAWATVWKMSPSWTLFEMTPTLEINLWLNLYIICPRYFFTQDFDKWLKDDIADPRSSKFATDIWWDCRNKHSFPRWFDLLH